MFSSFVEPLEPATGSSFVVFSLYRTAGSSHRFFVCSISVLSNCWIKLSVLCLQYFFFIELLNQAIGSLFALFLFFSDMRLYLILCTYTATDVCIICLLFFILYYCV